MIPAQPANEDVPLQIFVCMNIDCRSRGAKAVLDTLREHAAATELQAVVRPYMCFSACNSGPNVVIASRRCWFSGVQPTDAGAIVDYLKGAGAIPQLQADNDPDLADMIFDIINAGLAPDFTE